MATILVVDDDAHIREVLQYALERDGFVVRSAGDGAAGLELARAHDVDLVVLDILMPELDGLEVFRRLRAERDLPVVFLTSKADEIDRIVGLEIGADDYLAKPFSPRELVARVRAVLRRTAHSSPMHSSPVIRSSLTIRSSPMHPSARAAAPAAPAAGGAGAAAAGAAAAGAAAAAAATAPTVVVVGPVRVDATRHEVSCGGHCIALTVTEFAVLEALLRRPGQVMTRAVLVERAYSYDHHITERTIDTHVRRIRAKFRPHDHDPIETVHGLGYKARCT